MGRAQIGGHGLATGFRARIFESARDEAHPKNVKLAVGRLVPRKGEARVPQPLLEGRGPCPA